MDLGKRTELSFEYYKISFWSKLFELDSFVRGII